jgi:hypothetical protein
VRLNVARVIPPTRGAWVENIATTIRVRVRLPSRSGSSRQFAARFGFDEVRLPANLALEVTFNVIRPAVPTQSRVHFAANARTLRTSSLCKGSSADSGTAVTAIVSPMALNTSME